MTYKDESWTAFTYPIEGMWQDRGTFIGGPVVTPNGLVDCYSQDGLTMIDFVYGGKVHRRKWRKKYSKQYLVTLARELSEEKVNELRTET